MGANDAREQLEACKEEYGKLEHEANQQTKDNARLRVENANLRAVIEKVREWNDSPPGKRQTLASILLAAPDEQAETLRRFLAGPQVGEGCGKTYEELERKVAVLESTVERVRFVLAGHPRCDKHPDDDPVTCGWKRAVQDVRTLVEDGGGWGLTLPALDPGYRWRVSVDQKWVGEGNGYETGMRVTIQQQDEWTLNQLFGGKPGWSRVDSEWVEPTQKAVQDAAVRLYERHLMTGVY